MPQIPKVSQCVTFSVLLCIRVDTQYRFMHREDLNAMGSLSVNAAALAYARACAWPSSAKAFSIIILSMSQVRPYVVN